MNMKEHNVACMQMSSPSKSRAVANFVSRCRNICIFGTLYPTGKQMTKCGPCRG